MNKKYFILILVSILLLTSVSIFATGERVLPKDAVSNSEQILYFPSAYNGTYMDIMKTMQNRIGYPMIIQEALTNFDKNFEVKPGAGAAESWDVAKDGVTWTFHLQKDLKWSDGEKLTAHDYVFALKRAITEGYDFSWYYGFAVDIKNWDKVSKGELPFEELGLKAVDDYTLQIVTASPRPYLPTVLTWWFAVPEHIVKLYGDDYAASAEHLVCSGPFKVDKWIKGQKIIYVSNPEYNGAWKPYLNKIVEVSGTGEAEVGFPAYLSNELDVSRVNAGQLKYIQKNIPNELIYFPGYKWFALAMDTNMEPFTDRKVRKAIGLAIDRNLLCDTVLNGFSKPATTLLLPGYPGYNKDLENTMAYNPKKAKELLAEAGYPEGKGFPTIEILYRNEAKEMQIFRPLVEFIQNQLKINLGINVESRLVEMKTYRDIFSNRKHNLFLFTYGKDYVDPSNFMDLFKTGSLTTWSNSEYDKLVKEADGISNWQKRVGLYNKAEKIFLNEASAVPLVTNIFGIHIRHKFDNCMFSILFN